MTTWRMAFRCGNDGPSLWDKCRKHGLAVIQYDLVDYVDLSKDGSLKLPDSWEYLCANEKCGPKAFRIRECRLVKRSTSRKETEDQLHTTFLKPDRHQFGNPLLNRAIDEQLITSAAYRNVSDLLLRIRWLWDG